MKTTIMALAILLLGLTSISLGQQDTTWQKWNWLVGDWVGEGSGTPGQGGGWFSLRPDLDRKVLIRKNHSEYPATKDKPKIIHDDLMIVYLDYAGQPSKAIYFDNESHTITYALTYLEKSIIFTSSKAQSMPVFRLSYNSLDKETIGIKFEMSRDGETFQTYTEGKCTRKK
jgi:hypothetical protein